MKSAQVTPLNLGVSNAYLLHGDGLVLVDSGNPGNGERILAEIRKSGFEARDLRLILLTHGHRDHFGSAQEVQRLTGAPMALHRADLGLLRLGHNPRWRPTSALNGLLVPFFQYRFDPFEPDLVFSGTLELEPYGVNARVIETPGHTAGSVSVIAGETAIIADVIRGSFVLPDRPALHFFADDLTLSGSSLAHLAALPVSRYYTGHGQPFSKGGLRRWLRAREINSASPGLE